MKLKDVVEVEKIPSGSSQLVDGESTCQHELRQTLWWTKDGM
jgi:hypothetical protein